MTRRLSFLIFCSAFAACATAPEKKLDAREAFGGADAARGRSISAASPPSQQKTADTSNDLNAALVRFASTARRERLRVVSGAAMPSGAVSNWLLMNGAVDDFLRRPASKTSSFDVIRARATVEAELELDARAYGKVPSDLAENVLTRVNRLAVRMAQVRRRHVAAAREKLMFAWPIEPAVVTSLFGRRLHPITGTWKQHFGIDLAAEEGQLVSSAASGVVVRAGFNGAHGLQVEVQHADGILTRYSHLSQVLVERGLKLKRGDPLGLAGSTGVATGAHLHFEIWKGGNACDPLEELGTPLPDSDSVAAL